MRDVCILGIETSCDETAAAVVRSGERLLSNVVSSQIATHQPFGGVVPELASREHLRAIVPVVRQALAEAGESYDSVDAIAVTQGPGLAGALLVGISYAKALAYALNKPLITVNHLEGHIHAVLLEERQKVEPLGEPFGWTSGQAENERGASRTGARGPRRARFWREGVRARRRNPERSEGALGLQFPVLALVVSGGHTHLFLAREQEQGWKYKNIGRTRDDAAGEAYDKVAKLLGLGYPGGPVIDALAKHGNPRAVKFGLTQIKHPNRGTPKPAQTAYDFSFSGIKTAVLRYVQLEGMSASIERRREALAGIAKPTLQDWLAHCDQKTLDLVASFQRTVVEDLVSKTLTAARECDARTLFVTGGVAANSALRQAFEEEGAKEGLPVYFPSRRLSTDNAAMIAAAAYPKFLAGVFAGAEFSADASLVL
jgi:N6-L-threonylcarbamoyladenine synthase